MYFRAFVEVLYPATFRETWVHVSLGLIAWWYVTMLPFVLLLGPPLIRAVASAFPGLVSEEIKTSIMKGEVPRKSFSLAMILPGSLMLLIGIAITVVDPGQILALKLATFPLILAGMQAMFVGSGVILLVLGVVVLATGRLVAKAK